jgi:hypothetical protein
MIWELIRGVGSAIREFVTARKDRRATRPYFILQRSRVWRQTDGRFGLRVALKNLGPHPAEKLSLRIGLVNCKLDRPALYEWLGNSPQVPPDGKVEWRETSVSLAPDMSPHYVYAGIGYTDPMTTECYRQFFVRLWGGVSCGKPSTRFRAARGPKRLR